jgi:CMP-N,N'-diacetyllegionaminic acid synthase
MYRGKRILAIVPARGGSRAVPLKNIHKLAGVPLLLHVATVVQAVREIDRTVVSTDHDDIAAVATEAGLAVPFRRPAELSGDRIGDLEVLVHALDQVEKLDGCRYDVVVMLQPTSPLRRPEHVQAVIHRLIDESRDAVWTVSPTNLKYHPLKQLVIDDDGSLAYWDQRGARVVTRQELSAVYHRNGAAYAVTRDCLLEQSTVLGATSAAVVIDEPMISIDTEDDFRAAEAVLKNRAR